MAEIKNVLFFTVLDLFPSATSQFHSKIKVIDNCFVTKPYNICFLSQNAVSDIISTKSKFNPLLQHFWFPFSLRRFSTTTSELESSLKAFNNRQVRFNIPDKPNSVITFFQNHGFSHENICIMVRRAPGLLSSQPHKTLLPKFQFFLSIGASSSHIVSLLTANPAILRCSLEKRIIPLLQLLSKFFKTNKDTIACLIRHPTAFSTNIYHLIMANINLTTDSGVCHSTIFKLLQTRPSIFGSTDLIKSLEEVKGLGFHPSMTNFGVALLAKKGMSKKLWDEKVYVFKKWGWSHEAVFRAFRSRPSLMLTSLDKIDLLMNFWVNQLGWNSMVLAKYPDIFSYSLEKRIIPRASVLQFLLTKGLREKNHSLAEPLTYRDELFLSTFVFSIKEEFDYLLKLYEEKMKLASTKENNGMPSTKCVIY